MERINYLGNNKTPKIQKPEKTTEKRTPKCQNTKPNRKNHTIMAQKRETSSKKTENS